jgi:hypothetical protein
MIRGDSSGSFNGINLSMNNSGVVNADIKNGGSNVLASPPQQLLTTASGTTSSSPSTVPIMLFSTSTAPS